MQKREWILWAVALTTGLALGWLNAGWLTDTLNVIASIYTRLFQLVAVPTIALAVTTTLTKLGGSQETGRIFAHTILYTLLTTTAAAVVGLVLFVLMRPELLPAEVVLQGSTAVPAVESGEGYGDHLLSVIPNNVVESFLRGNVLSILLLSATVGLALAFMPQSEEVQTLVKGIFGLQELLFTLIGWLVRTLPLGILAYAAQLSTQLSTGAVGGSLGRYVAIILIGNLIQFVVILPLFLLARGLNPWKVLRAMSPAVVMALLTKSSAATLPVTIQSAEQRLKVSSKVARFVLPICTTANMNGCAAFILVTSLFVMQHGDTPLTLPTMILWVLIAVVSAVGNAGVPMGCYFLTLSLMTGVGAPVAIMGLILPLFTVMDMVETAENVWSDSCVCAMVEKDVFSSSSQSAVTTAEVV